MSAGSFGLSLEKHLLPISLWVHRGFDWVPIKRSFSLMDTAKLKIGRANESQDESGHGQTDFTPILCPTWLMHEWETNILGINQYLSKASIQ